MTSPSSTASPPAAPSHDSSAGPSRTESTFTWGHFQQMFLSQEHQFPHPAPHNTEPNPYENRNFPTIVKANTSVSRIELQKLSFVNKGTPFVANMSFNINGARFQPTWQQHTTYRTASMTKHMLMRCAINRRTKQ